MSGDIAIVGISAELPSGASSSKNLDHEAFFKFLLERGESYEPIPSDRFNVEAWKGTGAGKIHVDSGSFLKDIDLFDNVEFGISSRDARSMAPVTRKLIENCFLALLDSGIDYRARNVGCFTSGNAFALDTVSDPDEYESRGSFAGFPAMVANRVSNHLDLLGPSIPTDTACSSSLTALHLARQAILLGECEAAVVAGCQLNHRFADWITYSQASLLAKDGKCKPFDSSADGFAKAEGCVAIVIKPLESALRDRDHIYATILGTAVNCNGYAGPPGAPVAESQRDAMAEAFKRAGRSPRDVDYVELHATGTAKGDPTEANWVGAQFQRERELLIGSVKGNIGHTEIAAFLTSLSKVISIISHKVIPPTANLRNPNSKIRWKEYNLRAPTEQTALPCESAKKPLIAIAGSGIGGSNGHVVLEGPPAVAVPSREDEPEPEGPILLVAGGLSPRSATSVVQTVVERVAEQPDDLRAFSTVLGRRAKQMIWRSFAIVDANASSPPVFSEPQLSPRKPNPIVMLFSGQGPQHAGMGRELFSRFRVFRESVLEMDAVFKRVTGKSIVHDHGLFGNADPVDLPDTWPISLILPSIAIFQMALFDLLVSLGVKPDIVIGHSAGETAVLYASGAGSKAMAVELAIIRGRVFTPVESLGGTMAALSCGEREASQILLEDKAENPESMVDIACYNSLTDVAVAGKTSAIDRIISRLPARGVLGRKIRTRVPIHSSMMEACREEYCAALRDLFSRYSEPLVPLIPTYSTFTGERFSGSFDADYFWNGTRFPVRFTEAIGAISTLMPNLTLVELSPHPVLSSYASSMLPQSCGVLPTVRRPKHGLPSSEYRDLLSLLGKLTVAGHNCVDFTALNDRACYELKSGGLFDYPFDKKRYPLYPNTPGFERQITTQLGPINHQYLKMNKDTHPTLGEHVIRGEPIMPAAGFLEMAVEFGASALMNVKLRSIFSLSGEYPVRIGISLDGSYWKVTSSVIPKSSHVAELQPPEKLHADGYLSFEAPRDSELLDIRAIRTRCPAHVDSAFYPSLSYFSSYGPHLQRVTNVYYGRDEALASIKGMDKTLAKEGNYILHPAILDACIQVTAYKPFHGDFNPNAYYLPSGVDALILHQKVKAKYFSAHIYAHVELRQWRPASMVYDIVLATDSGTRLCTLQGLEVAKHQIRPTLDISRAFEVIQQPTVHPPRPVRSTGRSRDPPKNDKKRSVANGVNGHPYTDGNGHTVNGANGLLPYRPNGHAVNGPKSHRHDGSNGHMVNGLNGYHKEENDHCSNDLNGHRRFNEANGHAVNGLNDHQRRDMNAPSADFVITDSKLACIDALRAALSFLCRVHHRFAARIFVATNDDSLLTSLAPIFEDFPALYCEVFVQDEHQREHVLLDPLNGICRLLEVDFSIGAGPAAAFESFDVVIAFGNVSNPAESDSVIKTCSDLLVPSGSFILTCSSGLAPFSDQAKSRSCTATCESDRRDATAMVDACLKGLRESEHTVLATCSDSSHFTIESQKYQAKLGIAAPSPVYDVSRSFVFWYAYGEEKKLQWDFSGLNILQELDVWIITTEGRNGASALGLVRALRREFLAWTIRLVIFPAFFIDEKRQIAALHRVPRFLETERDLVVQSEDDYAVLRMTALPPLNDITHVYPKQKIIPPHHVVLRVHSSPEGSGITGFVASVVEAGETDLPEGSFVTGIMQPLVGEYMTIDADSLCPLSFGTAQQAACEVKNLPGYVAAVLAPGIAMFKRPDRMRSLKVLLTHADTPTGLSIERVYSRLGMKFVMIREDAGLLDIARLGCGGFDLILSGYDDHPHHQILQNLLCERGGKLYLWNHETSGLAIALNQESCAIGDALRCVINLLDGDEQNFGMSRQVVSSPPSPGMSLLHANGGVTSLLPRHAAFDGNKTYLILGGIGSIGARIALFMYERGARHIILTSRTGGQSLHIERNRIVRRIFEYLQAQKCLRLHLIAVDSASTSDMRALSESIQPSLGGCIFLTATLADGVFQHLNESQISSVFESKVTVFDVARQTIALPRLDFVVALSSVSGLFGIGGQSHYGAANTALEEAMSSLPNGFCFVCPGVLDSAMILASGADPNEARLKHLVEWSLPAEDMVQWLEDAFCRYQNGQRFQRYIPDLDWEAMDRTLGMPRLGEHILPSRKPTVTTTESETDRMADIIRDVLGVTRADFFNEVPLTAYGLDSLSASRIAFLLRPFVEVTQIQLLGDLSLDDIRRKIPVSASHSPIAGDRAVPIGRSKTQRMEDLVAKYGEGLKTISRPPVVSPMPSIASKATVLLTGSTGALGCTILAHLLEDQTINRVYAVNRKHSSHTSHLIRQRVAFENQGLSASFADSPKLILVEGDLTSRDLGLSDAIKDEMVSSVTHIIHNAWRVDFFASLDEFEGLINGTRGLLELAAQSSLPTAASMSFVSTVAVFQHMHNKDDSAAPEEPLDDPAVAAHSGYTESKWVAERLCHLAAERSNLRTNVIRVGLLTGSRSGSWDKSHWFPALVQSGAYVGCLPDGDETVSWLPMDLAAKAIVELRTALNETVHVVHPRPVSWNKIMEHTSDLLGVPLVPYAEWLARLESTSIDDSDSGDDSATAALKLSYFYRLGLKSAGKRLGTESMGLLPKVAFEKALQSSGTLRDPDVPQLGREDVEKWLRYWRNIGFLPPR